jgi:hypothetical protein
MELYYNLVAKKAILEIYPTACEIFGVSPFTPWPNLEVWNKDEFAYSYQKDTIYYPLIKDKGVINLLDKDVKCRLALEDVFKIFMGHELSHKLHSVINSFPYEFEKNLRNKGLLTKEEFKKLLLVKAYEEGVAEEGCYRILKREGKEEIFEIVLQAGLKEKMKKLRELNLTEKTKAIKEAIVFLPYLFGLLEAIKISEYSDEEFRQYAKKRDVKEGEMHEEVRSYLSRLDKILPSAVKIEPSSV